MLTIEKHFVYELTENNFRLGYFAEFIKIKKRYPTFKLNTACHIKSIFFWRTKLLENLLHAKYLISVIAVLRSATPEKLFKFNSGLPKLYLRVHTKPNLVYDTMSYSSDVIRD